MTKARAKPGELVEVKPLEAALKAGQKTVLIKTDDMEVVQFAIPAGRQLPTHEAQGELVLHCLEGRISVTAHRETYELHAKQLLYLLVEEPFSMQAIEASTLLVTMLKPRHGPSVELIGH